MATGVYKTTKKDGSVYYRVSITYKNKHISIGSYDDEFLASAAYAIANDILYKPGTYYIDKDMHTTSYNHIAAELSNNASPLIQPTNLKIKTLIQSFVKERLLGNIDNLI